MTEPITPNIGNHLHVVPVSDQIEHTLDAECVCGPNVELAGDGWLYTHHSLDGRELDSGGVS